MSAGVRFPSMPPPPAPSPNYTVMSWHWFVSFGFSAPLSWLPPLFRPFSTPVRGSINTRGLDTTFASCGAAKGTLITSIRNSAVLGSLPGSSPEHPASSAGYAQTMCGDVDINIVLVVRVYHQGMGVRASACLHGRYLLRVLDVGDIEDSHAAKAVLLVLRADGALSHARRPAEAPAESPAHRNPSVHSASRQT